jgi:hypothetical protein
VAVDGVPVFVYAARVRAEILQHPGLWTHKPDCAGERAAFAIFDVAGPVKVEVRPARPFTTATVLPARAGVEASVKAGVVRFALAEPRHVTVLLDGSDLQPLHLFIGAPEREVPKPGDPNVIYFGPGVHEITTLEVKSGQTVYLAGGAVVKAGLRPGEQPKYSDKWKVNFYHGVILHVGQAENVRISGRGVLDGSGVPHPGRNMIGLDGSRHVRIEGITLRDAPNWNVRIGTSQDVVVEDVRILSGRLNSDGINSVNSQRVAVRRCFVRNHDDSIVCKATEPGRPCEDISVEDCQAWDDWGYAFGVSYETRSPIRRVRFERCDVLFARHWCLGVYLSDSATVSDIAFRDIGVAPQPQPASAGAYNSLSKERKLMRMGIVGDVWGKDATRGNVRDVTVDGVTVDAGPLPPSELAGFDAEHTIDGVTFRGVRVRGQPPAASHADLALTTNAFVHNVRVEP